MASKRKATKPVTVYPQQSGMYQVALRSAHSEIENLKARLESLEAEKSLVEQRIKLVEGSITALTPLCADEEGTEQSLGLKEACVQVLKANAEAFTVPEIRAHLHAQGVQMSSSYKNPLAVLHTTLNRMVLSGDAQKSEDKDGKVRFRRGR
jgi:hypothetical protein